jgi:hypothetical protein
VKPLLQFDKHQESAKIFFIYALFGCTWIYFSDTAVNWLVHDPEMITSIAIFKGLLFSVCTSLLLFFLIARLSGKINESTTAQRESEERLGLLVKNSSDSLVIINADGRQRYVSPAAERIIGFPITELQGLNPTNPLFTNLQEINTAARRSADLPRQLLAFARKQTVVPKVLNARDAIAEMGDVTIKTEAATLDESYCATHVGYPGEYVLLEVSDTGCGMDSETLTLLFDPFSRPKKSARAPAWDWPPPMALSSRTRVSSKF